MSFVNNYCLIQNCIVIIYLAIISSCISVWKPQWSWSMISVLIIACIQFFISVYCYLSIRILACHYRKPDQDKTNAFLHGYMYCFDCKIFNSIIWSSLVLSLHEICNIRICPDEIKSCITVYELCRNSCQSV